MERIFGMLFFLVLTIAVSGQLTFDAEFENGRLDTVYTDSNEYVVSPVTNLHFRISNATLGQPVFKIFDSVGYQLRYYHSMVYRYEGDTTWNFFDTAYKEGTTAYYHFSNNLPFTGDTVYIAYWFPYTYSNLQEFLTSIQGSPYVQHAGAKGTTPQGRNLYGFEITDTSYADCYKRHVVVIARQHPIESINGYFIEGFADYLLNGSDSMAEFLRRNHRFFIYPMLNPDGVFNGSGQNSLGQGLNREWEEDLLPGGTPEIDTIRPVIWEETGQRVDWFIDIHSNPGSNIKYYWWGYTETSPVPQWQKDKAGAYVQEVSELDNIASSPGLFQPTIQGDGVNASKTAANWFTNTFNAVSFTFEPTSEPLGYLGDNRITISRLKGAGASLVKGFFNQHDTVPALGGTISQEGNLLIALVSGGFPPYTYAWEGPVTGNTDTLANILPGTYSLGVTDSLGCLWNSVILVQPNAIWENSLSAVKFSVTPNPTQAIATIETIDGSPILKATTFNAMGKVVAHHENIDHPAFQLDLSRAGSGIYFMHVKGRDFSAVIKLIRL